MWKAIKEIKPLKVRIIAISIIIWLLVDMIIGLLATVNGERIAGINLFILSSCCLTYIRTELK